MITRYDSNRLKYSHRFELIHKIIVLTFIVIKEDQKCNQIFNLKQKMPNSMCKGVNDSFPNKLLPKECYLWL